MDRRLFRWPRLALGPAKAYWPFEVLLMGSEVGIMPVFKGLTSLPVPCLRVR